MTNVHDILEKVRAAGTRLQPSEAAVLFAAAVRLAAAQGATLRSRLLAIDEAGVLHVASFDDQAPEGEPGYLAPELAAGGAGFAGDGRSPKGGASGDAPRKSEPRVQVYAAGALGYELLTGARASGRPPGAELAGPLGDIVRIALAHDRRERFGDLTQLHDAIEGVQPRPPAEGERNILMGLRGRWARPPPEKEALAKLIEKLGLLEAQVQQLAKAQGRVEAASRETAEHVDRFFEGQQRLQQRPQGSPFGPALLGGALASIAVVAAAWALGMLQAPATLRPPVAQVAPSPPQAAQATPQPLPQPAPAAAALDASVAAEPAAVDAGGAAAAPADAGAVAAAADAGAADAGALAVEEDPTLPPPAEKPPPVPPAPAKAAPPPAKKKPMQVSQAAMLHAVALSQVRRGESALEKGHAEEALESFRAALENEPTIAVAFRGMGMAYALQGNDGQALQAYDKYLKLAPSAADASDIRRSIAELKTRSRIGAGEK